MSQGVTVPKSTANATHKIEEVRIARYGHIMVLSGKVTCVYAQTGGYDALLFSPALPKPCAGIVYRDVAAGSIAIEEGRIRVHGGTVGASNRFDAVYDF